MKTKRTVLTQEALRILLHCSNYLPWEMVLVHLNKLMMKIQFSGYDNTFRYHVANSAVKAYMQIREAENQGIRPMHRPKDWERQRRRNEKESKRKNWYKNGGFDSVLFLPMTPGGTLKRMYERTIQKSGLRIKVVERTGKTLKSQLQCSNPFKPGKCGRNDCLVCTTTNKGNCQTEGTTYDIQCLGTPCRKDMYKGETGRNTYTRGVIHLQTLNAKNIDKSPLWRHCVEEHDSVVQKFSMAVTGTFRNDAMLRQISEAVQINNMDPEVLINNREEWNMARLPRVAISEE